MNGGLRFVLSIPVAVESSISINEIALANGSTFMQNQTGPSPVCTAADLDNGQLRSLVVDHEHLHADYYYNKTVELAGPNYEALIDDSSDGLLTQAAGKKDFIDTAAFAHSESLHQAPGGKIQPGCSINWNY